MGISSKTASAFPLVLAACQEGLLLCAAVGTGRDVAEGDAGTVTPALTAFAGEPLGGPGVGLWLSIFAAKLLGGKKRNKDVLCDGCRFSPKWTFP